MIRPEPSTLLAQGWLAEQPQPFRDRLLAVARHVNTQSTAFQIGGQRGRDRLLVVDQKDSRRRHRAAG